MKNRLSICKGKKIASVSDFSSPTGLFTVVGFTPNWPFFVLLFIFCNRQKKSVQCGCGVCLCVCVQTGLVSGS